MSKNTISKEQIKHIAQLARLDLAGDEEKFSELLSDTLTYVDVLEELDTADVLPTFQVTGMKNVFQKGKKQRVTLSQEEALSNAKEVIDGLFVTAAVFER